MYTLGVREHVMLAHSFRGALFGPAQGLHGATFVVDVEFERDRLDEHGLVIDIGRATELVRHVLAPINYKNLDALPEFRDQNTTTEFLCGYLHRQLASLLTPWFTGLLKVTLHESHLAWASYRAPVAA